MKVSSEGYAYHPTSFTEAVSSFLHPSSFASFTGASQSKSDSLAADRV